MFTSRRGARVVPLAAMILLNVDVLEAQACLGLGTPSSSSRMLSTTASGTNLGRSVSARYGLTSERGFGGVQLGATGRAFSQLYSPSIGGDIGAIIPLGASGATQLCPMFQTTYQNGPQNSSSRENGFSSSLGLSLGRAYNLPGTMQFIPFVQSGVQYVRQRSGYTSLGIGPNGESLNGAWSHTNTVFGEMAVGFGLRLSERLTLTPRYSVPIGPANRAGMYQQNYSLGVTLGIPR